MARNPRKTRVHPELLHETLGAVLTSACRVDLGRLERDYGAGVASEVLRQVIRSQAGRKRRR
jgi:hypothetical protein